MGTDLAGWDVELPRRGATLSSRGMRPTATLVMTYAGGEDERRLLPVAVGRTLMRLRDEGVALPATRAELLDRVETLSVRCAGERVSALVDRRDYSSQEVRERLRRDGYGSAVCDGAVSRAVECGLVDDARYGDVFIRTKLAGGWGRRRIERELARRGVDAASVPGWPSEYLDPDDEYERALEVARTRRIAPRNGYEKLVRYLAGRGYSLSLCMRVARQVVDERDEAS